MLILVNMGFSKFDYYAKPEGQDPVNKLMGLAKYGIATGLYCTLVDWTMYSHCTTTLQVLNTAGYWVVPCVGMCAAFSSVTYAATTLRKKDDIWNYVFGG